MYVLGFFVAWWGLRRRAKQQGSVVSPGQVEDMIFYGALGTILGGRIGSMLLYNFDSLLADPLSFFRVWEGGMSFHGALLGVILAMWIYARRHKLAFFAVTDFIAPWIPPGLGFGRIGNFINGELWGHETSPDAPWAVVVEEVVDGVVVGVPRHPSQLYEAFLEGLVLFLILVLFARRPRPLMSVSGLFLLGYGVFRFAVEFVRMPDDGIYLAWGWFTKGQAFSTPMIVFGLVLIVLAYRNPKTVATAGA